MSTVFPAAPETYVIELDPDSEEGYSGFPVIGWNHLQGNRAYPLTVLPFGGLTNGKAIRHPNGWVCDPSHNRSFANVSEWLDFMKTAPKKVNADAVKIERPEGEEEGESVPTGEPIQFSKKSYKTKSYWSMSGCDVIFQIEGGEPYPNDERCEKVTRDEYAALKKEGAVVIDPHQTPGEELGRREWTPDDDDGMDLV